MIFREIFRYEFSCQVRKASTWIYAALLCVFAFLLLRTSATADGSDLNAPAHIVFVTVLGSLVWLLIAAVVAGDAAARDMETRMHPLLYTTPVGKTAYLGGRFLAAFALHACLLLAVQAGMLLAFYAPLIGLPGLMAPFRPAAYLSAYFFIALPNAFVATAIQFSLAVWSRRAVAGYAASILLAVTAQFIGTTVAHFFGNWELVKLLDPVGLLGIISGVLETWTPAEKNTRLILPEGMFFWNRVLWLGIAMGMLLFTWFRFQLTHPATGVSWWSRIFRRRRALAKTTAAIAGIAPLLIPPVQRPFNFTTRIHQAFAIAWASSRKIAGSRGGLTVVAAMAMGSALFGSEIMKQFGIPLFPTTAQVVDLLTSPVGNIKTPWIMIPLLTIFYAGELVWREREAGLSDIADTVPVPEWSLFLGKFLGLVLIQVAWMTLLMAGGMLMQAGLGYYRFEIRLYLQTLWGLQLVEYLLFGLLVMVVHVLVNHKYLGHLAALLLFALIAFPARLGIHHNLLIFGAAPQWSYTDMRGFGSSAGPWWWFKSYWMACSLLLAVAAGLFWARGREQGAGVRLAHARRRFTRPAAVTAAVAFGLMLTLGWFIFYNTNIRNKYSAPSAGMEQQAAYELRYGRYRHRPQPRMTGTRLQVEIYPDRRAVDVKGTYRLVNSYTASIDTIHLATVPEAETGAVTFDRPAAAVLVDDKLGHRIYALEQPLQPGDSLQLGFTVHAEPQGFRNNGADALVAANGTYILNRDLLPAVGYQSNRELSNARERQARGLTPKQEVPSLYDVQARQRSSRGDWIFFEAVVGTAGDQTAVAPGALRRTWTRGGRRYFRYVTDGPIQNQYAFFCAKYAVHEVKWASPADPGKTPAGSGQQVMIRICYHPGHGASLGRMVRSIRASLDYYTRQFGAYPYGHLTVVERAGTEGELNAEASMIDYGEGFALFNPDEGPKGFDLPFYVIAHEMAHQFGSGYASVEGAPFLVEGVAVYCGMQVLEKNYGPGHLRRYLDFMRNSYELPRSRAAVPLLRANNAFLGYRKGAMALYALSRYIGQEKVNGALRSLREKHPSGKPPLPTTLDLYRELQTATPDSLHYLLHDLFETNTFWEFKTAQAAAVQNKAGAWQVTLDIQARKVVVDDNGIEAERPMNDWIEIGVFGSAAEDKPLYLQKHRIRSGKQTIAVTVPRKPARAGIDPDLLLIDLDMENNTREVTVKQ